MHSSVLLEASQMASRLGVRTEGVRFRPPRLARVWLEAAVGAEAAERAERPEKEPTSKED